MLYVPRSRSVIPWRSTAPNSVATFWTATGAWAKANQDRPKTQISTLQPFATYSIGGGYYVSSKGIMVFDFENSRYLIPLGVGFGKAFRAGNHMVNAFIEPEFTVYHKGAGQPVIQLYMGIKWQWPKAAKKG